MPLRTQVSDVLMHVVVVDTAAKKEDPKAAAVPDGQGVPWTSIGNTSVGSDW